MLKMIHSSGVHGNLLNVMYVPRTVLTVGGVGMVALLLLSEMALGDASNYAVYIKVGVAVSLLCITQNSFSLFYLFPHIFTCIYSHFF